MHLECVHNVCPTFALGRCDRAFVLFFTIMYNYYTEGATADMRGIGKIYTDADSIRSRLARLNSRNYISSEYFEEAMPKLLAFIALTEKELARDMDDDADSS